MKQFVFNFKYADTKKIKNPKNILGGKGANLAEMALLEIPVPPGCTITTEVCTFFNDNNQNYPKELDGQLKNALKDIENSVGTIFGDSEEFKEQMKRLNLYLNGFQQHLGMNFCVPIYQLGLIQPLHLK